MPVRPDGAEDYDVPVLTDGTVVLRRLEERDVPQLARNCADPAAAEFTTVPLGYTEADARWYVEEFVPGAWRAGREYNWAVADARTDRLHGTVGLNALRGTTADIGLNFGPHARGTGAAEAACCSSTPSGPWASPMLTGWPRSPTGPAASSPGGSASAPRCGSTGSWSSAAPRWTPGS